MRKAGQMAVGGLLAALAVVVMTLGGMIPIATYVCPMLCSILLMFVAEICGKRVGWAWYGTVSLLGVLLGPDKEAAAVFVFLGYYPMLKPLFDKSLLKWLWKILYFNVITLVLYLSLLYIFGMEQILSDFREIGVIGLVITLILGNVCFILLDRVLWLFHRKMNYKKKHPQI